MHAQYKAMAEELGDREGVAKACVNLGNCYYSTGDYARSREMFEECKAMAARGTTRRSARCSRSARRWQRN